MFRYARKDGGFDGRGVSISACVEPFGKTPALHNRVSVEQA